MPNARQVDARADPALHVHATTRRAAARRLLRDEHSSETTGLTILRRRRSEAQVMLARAQRTGSCAAPKGLPFHHNHRYTVAVWVAASCPVAAAHLFAAQRQGCSHRHRDGLTAEPEPESAVRAGPNQDYPANACCGDGDWLRADVARQPPASVR
jgi:hypothetical protein